MKTLILLSTKKLTPHLYRGCNDFAEAAARQFPRYFPGAEAKKFQTAVVVSGASPQQLQPFVDAFIKTMTATGEEIQSEVHKFNPSKKTRKDQSTK